MATTMTTKTIVRKVPANGETWDEMMTIALAYPVASPSEEKKMAALAYIDGIATGLNCVYCRIHFTEHVRAHPPDVTSRDTFKRWVHAARMTVRAEQNAAAAAFAAKNPPASQSRLSGGVGISSVVVEEKKRKSVITYEEWVETEEPFLIAKINMQLAAKSIRILAETGLLIGIGILFAGANPR